MQMSLATQTLCFVDAMVKTLIERGLLTPQQWTAAVERAKSEPYAVQTRESIDKILGIEPLEDILKNFEGPIQ